MAAPDHAYTALLRQSKVLRLSSKRPVAVTAPPEYIHRGDLGLKHAITPKQRRSPVLYVRSLDSKSGIGTTVSRPASAQALFLKKWEEVGATATPNSAGVEQVDKAQRTRLADAQGAPGDSNEPIPEDPESMAGYNGQARKSVFQNVDTLSAESFERLIQAIENEELGLRQRFEDFCEDLRKKQPNSTIKPIGFESMQTASDEHIRSAVQAFLKDEEVLTILESAGVLEGPPDGIRPRPHPTYGLSYAAPSYYFAAQQSPQILGRFLPDRNFGEDPSAQNGKAVVLGVVAQHAGSPNGAFEFDPKPNGFRDTAGETLYRIQRAMAQPPQIGPDPRDVKSRAQTVYAEQAVIAQRVHDGRIHQSTRTARSLAQLPRTPPTTVSLEAKADRRSLRSGGDYDNALSMPPRVGSLDYVATPPRKRLQSTAQRVQQQGSQQNQSFQRQQRALAREQSVKRLDSLAG